MSLDLSNLTDDQLKRELTIKDILLKEEQRQREAEQRRREVEQRKLIEEQRQRESSNYINVYVQCKDVKAYLSRK